MREQNPRRLNLSVVGAGWFGVEAACQLSAAGHQVTLYERHEDIMLEASEKNQARDHDEWDKHFLGNETNLELFRRTGASFRRKYGRGMSVGVPILFGLVREGSKTSRAELVEKWQRLGTKYIEDARISNPHLNLSDTALLPQFDSVDIRQLQFSAMISESFYDYSVMHRLVKDYLDQSDVKQRFGHEFGPEDADKHDLNILCAYRNTNPLLESLSLPTLPLRRFRTEKPRLRMPDDFYRMGYNIFDGPFGSLDLIIGSDDFRAGCVVEAVHATDDGFDESISPRYQELMRPGMRPASEIEDVTHFPRFVEKMSRFIKGYDKAVHVGSWFQDKTYLQASNDSDRPSTILQMNDKFIVVIGGKIRTCVKAGEEVVEMVERLVA